MNLPVFINTAESQLHGTQDEGLEGHFRLEVVKDALSAFNGLSFSASRHIADSELLLVHSTEHRKLILDACAKVTDSGSLVWDQMRVYPGSWNACASMAGGAVQAVETIIEQNVPYGWVVGRSPGHHAEDMAPMGYCLISNVAIAARVAQAVYGLRVAIFDFDVHEGNGTRQAIVHNNQVLMVDIFIDGHNQYPNRQLKKSHLGRNILEIPLPPGIAGTNYNSIVRDSVLGRIAQFKPDLIICSAGFDCMKGDPFGGFQLMPHDIYRLADSILELNLPTLFVLEGGYDVCNLQSGVTKVTEAVFKRMSRGNTPSIDTLNGR